eukprot:TRINITY_DN24257_c0_g1_i1.p1 TRINITY_DN24257_c0_g1~~TRINITY_DN24257_c0_g1_i1.p1  ORF type:complete len:786 (-),score=114.76 TRINITY_DN24257_c0_g1_i1:314-2671(-)
MREAGCNFNGDRRVRLGKNEQVPGVADVAAMQRLASDLEQQLGGQITARFQQAAVACAEECAKDLREGFAKLVDAMNALSLQLEEGGSRPAVMSVGVQVEDKSNQEQRRAVSRISVTPCQSGPNLGKLWPERSAQLPKTQQHVRHDASVMGSSKVEAGSVATGARPPPLPSLDFSVFQRFQGSNVNSCALSTSQKSSSQTSEPKRLLQAPELHSLHSASDSESEACKSNVSTPREYKFSRASHELQGGTAGLEVQQGGSHSPCAGETQPIKESAPATSLCRVPMLLPSCNPCGFGRPCALSFDLCCNRTQMGLHVRVVGNCPSLGQWVPMDGLQMKTSPKAFPEWRTTTPVMLPWDEFLEYKYVICFETGAPAWWENRPNRKLHLKTFLDNGHIQLSTCLVVTDIFESMDFADANRLHAAEEDVCSEQEVDALLVAPAQQRGMSGDLNDKKHLFEQVAQEGARAGRQSPCALSVSSSAPSDSGPRRSDTRTLFPSNAKLAAKFESCYSISSTEPLGKGAFGCVWQCTAKASSPASMRGWGKEHAAKIIRKELLRPFDMEHLIREVRIHSKMKHPQIAELREHFTDDQAVTLVVELCHGGDLFEALKAQSKGTGLGFSELTAVRVGKHLLGALAYMHSLRFVHRDVKCENVLLAHRLESVSPEQNVYKLSDFGLATVDNGVGLNDVVGSPYYVAPEMILGLRYSSKVDLWSLGILLYVAVAAQPPFSASTVKARVQQACDGALSFDSPCWKNVSLQGKEALALLLASRPSYRPTAETALQFKWLVS